MPPSRRVPRRTDRSTKARPKAGPLATPARGKLPPPRLIIPQPDDAFVASLKDARGLKRLLDRPATITEPKMDWRHACHVVVKVRDKAGRTAAGIEVRLMDPDGHTLLDSSYCTARGDVLLRCPFEHTAGHHAMGDIEAVVTSADGSATVPVSIPAGSHSRHAVVQLILEHLPVSQPGTETAPSAPIVLGDNPFNRLPPDFTTGLCDAVTQLFVLNPLLGLTLAPGVPDPIFAAAAAGDFRAAKTPLVRNIIVPRVMLDGNTARRFIVRVRQEWKFLNYTLGELAGVQPLDPGAVAQEVAQTLEEISQSTTEARETLAQSLSQISSIDTLLSVASSIKTRTKARAGAFGGGIGGAVGSMVGGIFGASASARVGVSLFANAETHSTTDTSLQVNSLLQSAQSLVNHALRISASTIRQVHQVSPLLSRVTNLLRWILYQNYAVCSYVQDVHEVTEHKITKRFPPWLPMFSDRDIVEYRVHFEPYLLEPQLAPHFAILRRAVEHNQAGGSPVTTIHVAVNYTATVFTARLRLAVGVSELELELTPESNAAHGVLHIAPVMPIDAGQLDMLLQLSVPSLGLYGTLLGTLPGSVTVDRIRLWFNDSPGSTPNEDLFPPLLAAVTPQAASATGFHAFTYQQNPIVTSGNPLYIHVNRNRSYYLGLLAQAALEIPSLRDNAPQLAQFPYTHPLWRLPILAFEADRALVLQDANPNDPIVKLLLSDEGSATIVQLAAPGAYGEALQGLLALPDALGLLHPELR